MMRSTRAPLVVTTSCAFRVRTFADMHVLRVCVTVCTIYFQEVAFLFFFLFLLFVFHYCIEFRSTWFL
jgi:hypothetical protein